MWQQKFFHHHRRQTNQGRRFMDRSIPLNLIAELIKTATNFHLFWQENEIYEMKIPWRKQGRYRPVQPLNDFKRIYYAKQKTRRAETGTGTKESFKNVWFLNGKLKLREWNKFSHSGWKWTHKQGLKAVVMEVVEIAQFLKKFVIKKFYWQAFKGWPFVVVLRNHKIFEFRERVSNLCKVEIDEILQRNFSLSPS